MKVTKVEVVRRANDEARKEEKQVSEATKKVQFARTLRKFGRFLAGQDEVITHAVIEMLPLEVCATTTNFYKFWTNRW